MEEENNSNNIDPVKTGKFIYELRKERGWSQQELGDKIFITYQSVSKWETGKCTPSIDMLNKLSNAFGVSVADLMAGEVIKPPIEESPAVEEIPKVNFNRIRPLKIFGIISGILLLIYLIISFIIKNTSKVFTINYEDDYFAISNGILVLGKESYLSLGRFIIDIDDWEIDNLNFVLYATNDDEMKEITKLNYSESIHLPIEIRDELLGFEKNGKLENLCLRIFYINERDEEVSYKLHIEPVISRKNMSLENVAGDDNTVIDDEHLNEKTLDVESDLNIGFLYEMSSESLYNCVNNQKISSGSNRYEFKYIVSDENIIIYYNDLYEFIISLSSKRIWVNKDEQTYKYSIINNSEIKGNMEDESILKILYKSLNRIKGFCRLN